MSTKYDYKPDRKKLRAFVEAQPVSASIVRATPKNILGSEGGNARRISIKRGPFLLALIDYSENYDMSIDYEIVYNKVADWKRLRADFSKLMETVAVDSKPDTVGAAALALVVADSEAKKQTAPQGQGD